MAPKSKSTPALHPPPASTEKKPTEFQSIASQFAAAKAAQEEELASGRSRDQKVKKRNLAAARNFRYTHGLLVALLLAFFYLHASGIYLFTRGFLLTRTVLENKSTCAVSPLLEHGDSVPQGDGCWHQKTFDKAVVVIVDALRFDFTVPYEGTKDVPAKPYHNAFQTPYQVAKDHPENAVLFPFIADPPTTTLQRLKGLTTGTLPTFIDAGSNFAGTVIEEDNMISQMKALGKRMAFMGDDTWMALFPGMFEKDMEHPYESLNVWDLHTVDNGVNEHIFPLLAPTNQTRWDVLFAHYLGVDHAGHRYGPDHPAMTEKLQQMDDVVKQLMESIDHKTLLVVMGDHGMDSKGDHGGESQGEIEAAIWMYSKKPVFGQLPKELQTTSDEHRPIPQIDLVPTLSLLLGLPIPFNNLGAPIPEAFIGTKDDGLRNLAQVSRLTAAQIKRYQHAYTGASHDDVEHDSATSKAWESGQAKWKAASRFWKSSQSTNWIEIYRDFSDFQHETLRICKNLWARFDFISMAAGIVILVGSIGVMFIYARAFIGDRILLQDLALSRIRYGGVIGTVLSLPVSQLAVNYIDIPKHHFLLFGIAMGIIAGFLSASINVRQRIESVLPKDPWGMLSLVITILYCVMFGSNSFTIWEDKILTYFISTFSVFGFIGSLKAADKTSRTLGTYHSVMLLILTRVAAMSRLCREEQMPYCESTFYATASSSVSAPWTLVLLGFMAVFLPSIIKSFYTGTKSYEGPAPLYIGWAFRLGLVMSVLYWTLDSADNASWLPGQEEGIKASKLLLAQIVLALAFVAGSVGFGWSSLCLNVEIQKTNSTVTSSSKDTKPEEKPLTPTPNTSVFLLGFANVHGSRYFLLVLSWGLGLILLQKPMGALSLGILLYQILTVLEILDVNNLSTSSIGPVVFALLGNAHFFSTGHQAALSSIQWDAAFIPMDSIRYPWSPLLIVGNTLGSIIITALAVPLVALWKAPAKRTVGTEEGVLGKVAKAVGTYTLFQVVVGTASVICAAWLRRHLMLYRIFMPRFMLGAVTVLVGELVAVVAGVGAVRWNMAAVGEIFGYA